MPSLPVTFADDVISLPARAQFEAFIDEHRGALNRCLDGLTEEQARRSLVPSSLGLEDQVYGYRLGPLPLRWVYLQCCANSRSTAGTPTSSGSRYSAGSAPGAR